MYRGIITQKYLDVDIVIIATLCPELLLTCVSFRLGCLQYAITALIRGLGWFMPLVGTLDLEIVRWKSVYYRYKHIYIYYVKYNLYERIVYIYIHPISTSKKSNMKMKARDWESFKSVFIASSVYHPADTFIFFPLDLFTEYSARWVKRSLVDTSDY